MTIITVKEISVAAYIGTVHLFSASQFLELKDEEVKLF